MNSLDELTDLDIDHRVLNLFRVTINKEYQSFQNISEMEFHKFWNQSFKPTETNDKVYMVLTKICACESDSAQISIEKFNNLVSLYQVHPALKKGEKNDSPGL